MSQPIQLDLDTFEIEEELTSTEMLQEIAEQNDIKANDWFGKYLLLQLILNNMDKEEANEFLEDTFDVLEDEIESLYKKEIENEQVA